MTVYAALQYQQTQSHDLFFLALNLLVDGEIFYLSRIAALEPMLGTLPGTEGTTFLFSISAKEKEELEMELEGVVRGMDVMRAIREALVELFPKQGIVRRGRYDKALDALAKMKEQIIQESAQNENDKWMWQNMWPFDDKALAQE